MAGEPPHAPRRRLIFLLSGSAGYLDAVGYLTLGLFTANMTGNTVLLGIAVGQGRLLAVSHALLALLAFLAGGASATALLLRGRRLAHAFALEAVLLLAALAAWSASGLPPSRIPAPLAPLLIALLAGAMGAQSAAVRRVGEQRISTTYVTGLLTSVVTDAVAEYLRGRWQKAKAQPRAAPAGSPQPVLIGIWSTYLFGGAAGGFAETHVGFAAVALPWLVLTCAAAWERLWTALPPGREEERTG